MRYFFAIFSTLMLAFGVASHAQATVTTTELQTVVKIEIRDEKNKLVGGGAGVQIDADGRVLTSYAAVRPWEGIKKQPITLCATKDTSSEPKCTWQATLIKTNPTLDLALLQIRTIYVNDRWMPVEEFALRSSFAFTPVKAVATSSKELVNLGDTIWIAGYPTAGGSTITTNKTSATGFKTRTQKKTSLPWMVKADMIFGAGQTGGAAFSDTGAFVGIPAFAATSANQFGAIIGIPAINVFLNEALGADYQLGKTSFVFKKPLVGVHAGTVPTTSCPDFSSMNGNTKTCACNPGFFAVGNACIQGAIYCSLRFPATGTYDGFLKQCRCPTANDGSKECALPATSTPKPVTPATSTSTKPVAATTTVLTILQNACKSVANASWNTTSKACECKKGFSFNRLHTACVAIPKITCPANASLDTKANACTCAKPYSMNAAKSACILVGKPTTKAQLTSCEVIGNTTTKKYYLKGHAIIKWMTFKGKTCFANEAAAKKAKYVKAK